MSTDAITMTPFLLDILMHYYTRGNDYRDGDFNEGVKLAIAELRSVGLLDANYSLPGKSCYQTTDRANAYIEAILSLPLPVRAWIMPATNGTGEAGK